MKQDRKFNEEQSADIIKYISNTLITARMIQHLCWEIQPDMLRLCKILERGDTKLLASEQTVFSSAKQIADSLNTIYNTLPGYIKRDDVSSTYLLDLYNDITCLEDIDEIVCTLSEDIKKALANARTDQADDESPEGEQVRYQKD